jgi:nucleoid DNA-binding protein
LQILGKKLKKIFPLREKKGGNMSEKPKMNQKDLVLAVSQLTDCIAEELAVIIDTTVDVILEVVAKGGKVYLNKFGKFQAYERKGFKVNRHLIYAKKGICEVPPTRLIKFYPTSETQKYVNSIKQEENIRDGIVKKPKKIRGRHRRRTLRK